MTCGDIAEHNCIGADDGAIPDSDVPQHLASDAEVNTVADDRNALPAGVRAMHEADAAVDRTVVADNHAVGNEDRLRGVNHKPAANDSARLDLRTCYGGGHKPQKSAEEAHRTSQQRESDRWRPMCQSIGHARPEIAVAQRGEFAAFDGRVGREIFFEQGGNADRSCN